MQPNINYRPSRPVLSHGIRILCVTIVLALSACLFSDPEDSETNVTNSELKDAFIGQWEGKLFAGISFIGDDMEFDLNTNASTGKNLSVPCDAALKHLDSDESTAFFEVTVLSGPCLDKAILQFTLDGPDKLKLLFHSPGSYKSRSQTTVLGTGYLNRK